jgi:hypothetical protein
MKRGILVATLMVTAAGVASANLLTTAPQGVASPWPQQQPATEAAPVVAGKSSDRAVTDKPPAEKRIAQSAPTAPAKVASVQTTQKSLAEAQQAPVPFKMKPRPPVNLPPAADKATDAKATDKAIDKPAESSDGVGEIAGENAARAAIEADGYKGVKVLRKGANGIWHASALRGKTTVMLTVDASGSVSAD